MKKLMVISICLAVFFSAGMAHAASLKIKLTEGKVK